MTDTPVLTFRKLVKPEDLNPMNHLFGGRVMEWADEAACLYVMCQLGSRSVVTLKVSEILFKEPVCQGDFLEFLASTLKVGKTSITVKLTVRRRHIESAAVFSKDVLTCDFTFVHLDQHGKPYPHKLAGRT